MPRGVVQWFDRVRGVGVIRGEGGGPEMLAEYSAVQGCDGRRLLRRDDLVRFDVVCDAYGVRAENICRVPPVG
ncbi:cold-shock protein [Streptomyces olivoreticuli]